MPAWGLDSRRLNLAEFCSWAIARPDRSSQNCQIAPDSLALRWVVGNRRAYPALLGGRGFPET